jgi:hypothetical protein
MYKLRGRKFSYRDAGLIGEKPQPFKVLITESDEFEFGTDDISRIRDEFRTLLERLSVLYVKWKADRDDQRRKAIAARSKKAHEKPRNEIQPNAELNDDKPNDCSEPIAQPKRDLTCNETLSSLTQQESDSSSPADAESAFRHALPRTLGFSGAVCNTTTDRTNVARPSHSKNKASSDSKAVEATTLDEKLAHVLGLNTASQDHIAPSYPLGKEASSESSPGLELFVRAPVVPRGFGRLEDIDRGKTAPSSPTLEFSCRALPPPQDSTAPVQEDGKEDAVEQEALTEAAGTLLSLFSKARSHRDATSTEPSDADAELPDPTQARASMSTLKVFNGTARDDIDKGSPSPQLESCRTLADCDDAALDTAAAVRAGSPCPYQASSRKDSTSPLRDDIISFESYDEEVSTADNSLSPFGG